VNRETLHLFLKPTSLNIGSPDEIETGPGHMLFVEDNDTFITRQLSTNGKLMSSFPDDARWFSLASQGFWTLHPDVLKEYSQIKDSDISVLGISRGVVLIVHHDLQPMPEIRLDGWSLEGRKIFSIPLKETAAQMLGPQRVGEIRPVRVGQDGTIYAMDNPDSTAFHIYRFDITP
jgi:hypothetical protein